MTVHTEPWSANAHYHWIVFEALPGNCSRALDVGCGRGALTRSLRARVAHVTGVDKDECSIQYARACADSDAIDHICSDFLSVPLPAGTYDGITAVASLHHMDASPALARMRDLLRPGGVLVVIGLARGGSPADIAWHVLGWVGAFLHRSLTRHRARLRNDTYAAPLLWPPPLTYRGMRLIAEQLLPGSRYRRLLYWRYALLWTKPAAAA